MRDIVLSEEQLNRVKRWNSEGKESSFNDPPSFDYFPKFTMALEIIQENDHEKVLDVGCYTGYFIRHLAKLGIQCSGVDIQKDLMARLNKDYAGNPKFKYGNAEQLPFDDETFDVVTLFDVLEHCLDDKKAIREAERVTKNNGMIIINLPKNCEYPDHSGEHVRNYDASDIHELFGHKALVKAEDGKDEEGRPTWFIAYRV